MGMLEELRNASNRLQVALDDYVHICSNIRGICLQGATLQGITSDHVEQVEQELGLVESYDSKMQLAKTAIKMVRNYAFNITPINHLPTETLTRIFYMARDIDFKSVDCVTLVCSRWRTIALRNPSLWTDVHLRPTFGKQFYPSLDRAHTHVLRSGEAPLDIYISSLDLSDLKYCGSLMADTCRLSASRMRSLSLNFEGFGQNELDVSEHVTSTSLFSNCTPGLFTKLVTRSQGSRFFGGRHRMANHLQGAHLDEEESQLEAVLASTTVLELTGLYPQWTSKAYHGLVELRLATFSSGEIDFIPEAQLVNILQCSPELRILEIGLKVIRRGDRTSNITVSLPKLEVLKLGTTMSTLRRDGYLDLVRFLTLDSLSLDFTMRCHGQPLTESSEEQTKAFLSRSNITRFRADKVTDPFDFLPFMPHLKTLILTHHESSPRGRWDVMEPLDRQKSSTITYPKLEICVVLGYRLSLDEFRSIMEQCQVQTIIIHGGGLYRGIDRQTVDTKTVLEELSRVCPHVKITDTIPRFVMHQDFFFDSGAP